MKGTKILNYVIDSKIGSGGMGNVYLAYHIQLKRKVAIKILHHNLLSFKDFHDRFRAEALALSNLNHQGIVTLYDFVESKEMMALIMEYVDGVPLDEYLKNYSSHIPENELIEYFVQILDALQYAHDRGIVHRDVKPANLLLTPDKKIKILDFGIAKMKGNLTHTQTGTKIGTVFYMSPEQIKGQKVSHLTDIYSLGVTLFELASGTKPYDESMTEFVISNLIVKEPLPTLKSSNHLHRVIQKATAKDPNQRFQSCKEFANALKNQNESSKTVYITPSQTQKSSTSALFIALILGIVFLSALYISIEVPFHFFAPKPLDSGEIKQAENQKQNPEENPSLEGSREQSSEVNQKQNPEENPSLEGSREQSSEVNQEQNPEENPSLEGSREQSSEVNQEQNPEENTGQGADFLKVDSLKEKVEDFENLNVH